MLMTISVQESLNIWDWRILEFDFFSRATHLSNEIRFYINFLIFFIMCRRVSFHKSAGKVLLMGNVLGTIGPTYNQWLKCKVILGGALKKIAPARKIF